jgi:hypothetical protein
MPIKIFFSLSLMTDMHKFEIITQTKGLPYHNLKNFNWIKLASKIHELLTRNIEHPTEVIIGFWPDSLDSASKPVLTDEQQAEYMTSAFKGLAQNNFKAVTKLRQKLMVTPIEESSPPQNFYFMAQVTEDHLEDFLGEVETHFYNNSSRGNANYSNNSLMFEMAGFQSSGKQSLSNEMLNLFNSSFDNPFANDIALVVLNQRSAFTIHGMV